MSWEQRFGFLLIIICFSSFCVADVLRFESENGHVIGGSKVISNGYSGSGYVNFDNDGDKIIFTVNSPSDGSYNVTLNYSTTSVSIISTRVNGYSQPPTKLFESSQILQMNLDLRQGINTIILKKEEGSPFSSDFMEVIGAVPLAVRGATLPYIEYEAEDANHNGVIIGPDRTYMALPSEASGRKAVQITNSGDYVEFTLTSPANGIVVRFSIPDTPDGSGQVAYLGVLVDGTEQLNLTVTSKYSWAYGGYPFTKRPGDGSPHHFYDETRGLFATTLPTGTKVRLSPLSPITYTIDLADFYLVPAPYPRPSNFLSVTDFGADPTGLKDSTTAFQNAITSAQSKNQGIWIPQGFFTVTTRFTVNNLVVRGAGPWYSTVHGTVNHGVGFFGNWAPNPSVNVELYDFTMLGDTNVRDDSAVDSGVGGALTNSLVQNVWIEHTKCGMWLDGPFSGLHVVGTTIRNTYADGINLHKGISNVVVEQSIFRNVGDDALAMWSDQVRDDSNVFRFNTIQIPVLANGIAIYGGNNNSATDNVIMDTICEGGGLQASNRFNSVLLSGTTVMARNTVVRCGAPNRWNTNHNGALWFWSNDGPMTSTVNLTDIDITDSSFAGITFWGTQMTNLNFNNIKITIAPYAAEVNSVVGQATFTNTVAKNLSKGGIDSCDVGFKINQEEGCSGWSDSHCGFTSSSSNFV